MSREQTIAARPRPLPGEGLAPWVDETGWCVHVVVSYARDIRSSAVIAVKDHDAACGAYRAAIEVARRLGVGQE